MAPVESIRPSLRFNLFWIVPLLIILLAAGIYSIRYELRSYVFLIQFLDPHASGLLVRLESHGLDIQEVTLSTTQGPVRARLYVPRGVAHPPGMVLVHGIHHLGIDEPRLMNFARAAASDGFSVLTPRSRLWRIITSMAHRSARSGNPPLGCSSGSAPAR